MKKLLISAMLTIPLLFIGCKPVESDGDRRQPVSGVPKPKEVPEVPKVEKEDPAAREARELWQAAKTLSWSLTGPIEGKTCINFNSPLDLTAWEKIHLCWEGPLQLELSHTGEQAGASCIQIRDLDADTPWASTYLCQPQSKSTCLRFIDLSNDVATPDASLQCLNLAAIDLDPAWNDNFLCTVKEQSTACPALPEKIKGEPFTDLGEFRWINDGNVPAGWHCHHINEPSDASWGNNKNFLCFKEPVEVQWTKAGKVADKNCISIQDQEAPDVWKDNFLCFTKADHCLRFSENGPISDMECVNLKDASNPIWANNFLCKPKTEIGCPIQAQGHEPEPTYQLLPGLQWTNVGRISQKSCLQIIEPGEVFEHAWHDNYLCWNQDFPAGLEWSFNGPISGRACTKIHEPKDTAKAQDWDNNYLCATNDRYCLRWSHQGPIAGMDCLRIHEEAEPTSHDWANNYLCVRRDANAICPE